MVLTQTTTCPERCVMYWSTFHLQRFFFELCVLRNKFLPCEHILPTHFLSVHSCKNGRRGSGRACRRQRQWHVQGWFCWWRCTSRCVPFDCRQAQDARHHGRYGPEGQVCRWRVEEQARRFNVEVSLRIGTTWKNPAVSTKECASTVQPQLPEADAKSERSTAWSLWTLKSLKCVNFESPSGAVRVHRPPFRVFWFGVLVCGRCVPLVATFFVNCGLNTGTSCSRLHTHPQHLPKAWRSLPIFSCEPSPERVWCACPGGLPNGFVSRGPLVFDKLLLGSIGLSHALYDAVAVPQQQRISQHMLQPRPPAHQMLMLPRVTLQHSATERVSGGTGKTQTFGLDSINLQLRLRLRLPDPTQLIYNSDSDFRPHQNCLMTFSGSKGTVPIWITDVCSNFVDVQEANRSFSQLWMDYQLFNWWSETSKPHKGNLERHTRERLVRPHSHSDNCVFESIDHVPPNIPNSSHSTQLYLFEDNAAVIQMINKGWSSTGSIQTPHISWCQNERESAQDRWMDSTRSRRRWTTVYSRTLPSSSYSHGRDGRNGDFF